MGYTLSAFIGKAESLKQQALQLPDAKLIMLNQGFAMVPIKEAYPNSEDAVMVEPFYNLSTQLFEIGSASSAIGPIGFIDIELFGGYGERAAVLWQNQEIIYGPAFCEDSSLVSNHLFSLLGAQKEGSDEFNALGLYRYRSNEDWIKYA